jgi:hypothetical protein
VRQETAAGDILATGIHLTLEGVGIQELYVTHGPSNGLVSGDEKGNPLFRHDGIGGSAGICLSFLETNHTRYP